MGRIAMTTSSDPIPREVFEAEVGRHTIVAEAKILVKQLDAYLALIGEWAEEGLETADAAE
jgi:hypothetical protein